MLILSEDAAGPQDRLGLGCRLQHSITISTWVLLRVSMFDAVEEF